MKRSDQALETPINTKEPRLEVEESAAFVLNRWLRKVRKVTTILQLTRALQYVKKSLRRSLEQRQELKLLQAASKESSQESSLKKITEGDMMNAVKYCCYQCGLFLRGVISQWAHSCKKFFIQRRRL